MGISGFEAMLPGPKRPSKVGIPGVRLCDALNCSGLAVRQGWEVSPSFPEISVLGNSWASAGSLKFYDLRLSKNRFTAVAFQQF